jgi:hypothetical protein
VVSNRWITRNGMPFPRWNHATAAVTNAAGQSILYVMAGSPPFLGSSTVQAYNVATNRWTLKAPGHGGTMPNGAGVIKGKI